MAIARNPKRNQTTGGEKQAQAFISGAGAAVETVEMAEEKQKEELRSRIKQMHESGASWKEIAAELNKEDIPVPSARSDKKWSVAQVQRLLAKKDGEPYKEAVMIRIDPNTLNRIDHAAKRLGIGRSAFIVSSAAIRLESME